MKSRLLEKVNRLNELFHKSELGNELNIAEINEQKILRDEVLNYLKFAITKDKTNQ